MGPRAAARRMLWQKPASCRASRPLNPPLLTFPLLPSPTRSVSMCPCAQDHGKVSATASLGCVLMWDVEGGLPQIDKYLYAPDPNVVAGALLAVGITTNCVRTEYDPAFALISEHVSKESREVRLGAILGLGIAYAGAGKEDVSALLNPVVTDPSVTVEVAGYAALSLGLVFVGTSNQECAESIVQALMTRSETELDQPLAKLLVLGLALLFLGQGSAVEATVEVAKTLSPRLSRYCQALLEGCAYAGTGNVLKVQSLLAVVGEHIEKEARLHTSPPLLFPLHSPLCRVLRVLSARCSPGLAHMLAQ